MYLTALVHQEDELLGMDNVDEGLQISPFGSSGNLSHIAGQYHVTYHVTPLSAPLANVMCNFALSCPVIDDFGDLGDTGDFTTECGLCRIQINNCLL